MKKILMVGMVWPEPNATAAGGRMLQLVRFFLKNGYAVNFASTAQPSEHSLSLEEMGVQRIPIRLNHSSFDSLLGQLRPDIVLFDRFLTEEQFGWRVAQQLPQTLRVLDTEDLHSLRSTRQEACRTHTPFSLEMWLQADITKREMASIFRCDLSLIVSTVEMHYLHTVVKMDERLLLHLPFLIGPITRSQRDSWLPYEKRNSFVCIGNGKHAPNVDAIHWLKQTIWPLIGKELPQASLKIYGAYLPQGIQQLHDPKNRFLVLGRANDAREVLGEARVSLAPLRFGAGIKGKLTDSMCSGTPSVTTPIGAEGMHDGLPWSGAIADGAMDFAQKAVDLHNNRTAWEQAQRNGIKIIKKGYDRAILEDRFLEKLEKIAKGLEEHRKSNFMGSMLMHHTMASTKYLSKWIEAKNP